MTREFANSGFCQQPPLDDGMATGRFHQRLLMPYRNMAGGCSALRWIIRECCATRE
jgi:hypothetical protein